LRYLHFELAEPTDFDQTASGSGKRKHMRTAPMTAYNVFAREKKGQKTCRLLKMLSAYIANKNVHI
jgi:hypothetical protein